MDTKNIRILFMGTPIFAREMLKSLLENNWNIVGVVTQPDKKVGRKQKLSYSSVKELALSQNIEVFQPNNIKEETSFLDDIKPELIVTAAYGQIVPRKILDYPKFGCINVHGSLLPKYRGGAPIHYAILNGDKETGVTIMKMVQKMDAGDIISKESFPIRNTDNLETVINNMIIVGKKLLNETIEDIIAGKSLSCKQDESLVTYAPIITKADEKIDWEKTGVEIHNKIRSLSPNPGAYGIIEGKRVKIFESIFIKNNDSKIDNLLSANKIGEIISVEDNFIEIYLIDGVLRVFDVQIEGRKRMEIKDISKDNNVLKTHNFLI